MSVKGLKAVLCRKVFQLLGCVIILSALLVGSYAVLAEFSELTTFVTSPTVDSENYGNGTSLLSSLSNAGERVAFDSYATNLIDGSIDPDGYADIFTYDTTHYVPPELDGHGEPLPCVNNCGVELQEATQGANGNSLYPVTNIFPDNLDRYNYWASIPSAWKDKSDWDGRYVAFQSRSSQFNLMNDPDPGPNWDVFLYDRGCAECGAQDQSAQILPVSVPFDPAAETDGNSGNVGLVAPFLNSAHLGHIAANTVHPGVAVYTRAPASILAVPRPVVVFESNATNLLENPTTAGRRHIFARDMGSTPPTTLLTRTPSGEEANGDSTHPSVSPDGRFVAFVSYATNLVTEVNTGGLPHIYLLDRDVNGDGNFKEDEDDRRFYMVSRVVDPDRTAQGAPGNDESWNPSVTFVDVPGMNSDAVYVAFQSFASNFVDVYDGQADTNNAVDVFVYILLPHLGEGASGKHTLYKVSRASGLHGAQGNFHSLSPAISSDGQVIAFTSYATNLIKGDTNYFCEFILDGQTRTNCPDVYVRNFDVKQTWRVSVNSEGEQPWFNSALPAISGNGRYVAFTSYADLRLGHYGDQTTSLQVYVRDQGEYVGSPNMQPSAGDFYTSVGQPVWITFTLDFLQDVPLQIENGTELPISIEGTNPEYFEIVSDTCSHNSFIKGQQCTFAVQFTPTDQRGKKARVKIPIMDKRGNLYISLRGFTIVRYIPLMTP